MNKLRMKTSAKIIDIKIITAWLGGNPIKLKDGIPIIDKI